VKIPDVTVFSSQTRVLQDARNRVTRAQTIATTGLAQVKGSDDPAWLEANTRTRTESENNERIRNGLNAATSRLQATEASLGQIADIVAGLGEIAVQGASDTYSATDRRALAAEMRSLKEATLGLANTKDAGGYLFGGFRTGVQPFTATGAYVGDANVMQVDAGDGRTTGAGIDATAVFAPPGGVDVFALFDALSTALDANDGAAVRARLDDVTTVVQQISSGRAEAGDYLNAASRFGEWLDAKDERLAKERVDRVDADPIAAYSELSTASSSLEGALRVASKAAKLSLVDFL
jgi:flagellar hook-associated protein 3 FlgL